MTNVFFVPATTIAQVNPLVPVTLQVEEVDQELPDFLIQDWIDILDDDPGNAALVTELQTILAGTPIDEESLSAGLGPDTIRTWNGLKIVPLTSNMNDFADVDFTTITGWRFELDAFHDVSGIVNPIGDTQAKWIFNDSSGSGNRNLNLDHENTGSAAENRFYLPGEGDFTVLRGQSVCIVYDTVRSRWVLFNSDRG